MKSEILAHPFLAALTALLALLILLM